jgi:hypothetical protein
MHLPPFTSRIHEHLFQIISQSERAQSETRRSFPDRLLLSAVTNFAMSEHQSTRVSTTVLPSERAIAHAIDPSKRAATTGCFLKALSQYFVARNPHSSAVILSGISLISPERQACVHLLTRPPSVSSSANLGIFLGLTGTVSFQQEPPNSDQYRVSRQKHSQTIMSPRL